MTLAHTVYSHNRSTTGLFSTDDIVGFGSSWARYGGAPALDIMVAFGWSTNRYFTELRDILAAGPPDGLSAPLVDQMLVVCRHRIWMGR